jgi:dTDP-4-amino-4,6-dideoxygalactose transaminase
MKYRPAGNSIALKRESINAGLFYPFNYQLYQSGTASLAAAVAACVNLKIVPEGKPEVILPAYACPDIVSAAINAGAKPVLVDLEEDSPFLSAEQAAKYITPNTIAIIAINFMGLPGNIAQLKNTCKKKDLYLIYDSAQWFPLDKEYKWPGDFNTISFGRGKPVNLLHGGAVIVDDSVAEKALPVLTVAKRKVIYGLIQSLKIRVYNFIIQPFIYRFVCQLPGLNIGQPLYKPLETITTMSSFYTELIKHNVEKFRLQRNALQYLHKRITNISHPLLINLVAKELDGNPDYLLRYPILIKDKKIRDQFYEQTRDYGSSLLYQRPLNQIGGLENILDQEADHPNASDFADHLVTLPCHEDIDNAVIDLIVTELCSVLNDSKG